MDSDRAFKISIQGDATSLGAATKQAVGQLNEVRQAALALISGFTGGLIGGGVAGAVQAVVQIVGNKIREARELLEDADRLNVDPGTARGIRNLGSASGLDIAAAVQAARGARSEALAGDPNFTKAFERLGISLQSIQDLDPAGLFYRLVDAMEQFDPAAKDAKENFAALASILGGRSAAGDLTSFARGGLFRENRLFGDNGELMAAVLSDNVNVRAAYKRDFELPGSYGVGDEIKAARLRQENDQRELANKRALLTVEEQLKAVAVERAKIQAAMAATTDVVRKERLRSDILSLDSESLRLRQELANVPAAPSLRNVQSDADQYARMGLFIGGGRGVSLQEQQVNLLRELKYELQQSRTENEENWG